MAELAETAEMLCFTRTVEAKSLTRAAAELGQPRATISRRLARLEHRLGVRLLRRTTRSLTLTDAGEQFYQHARLALEAVEAAERSVRRAADDGVLRGRLRISTPSGMGDDFAAIITAFTRAHPEVQVHVFATSEVVDLARDGYDVAIRASTVLDLGTVTRTLAHDPRLVVASPKYLAAHGTPRTRVDLRRHRCIMGFARGQTPQTHWPLKSGGQVHVAGAMFTNELHLGLAAALDGQGLALLPHFLVADELRRGRLVHVLAGVIGAMGRVVLAWRERELMPPQLRAFIDAVCEAAPRILPPRADAAAPGD